MTTKTSRPEAAGCGLYSVRAGCFEVVEVPKLAFAWVDGEGPPQGPGFQAAIRGLFPITYGVHFALARRAIKEKVSPLEALWWNVDTLEDPADGPPDDWAAWHWSAMIRLPAGCAVSDVEEARAAAADRHPEEADHLDRVDFRHWTEGLSVQTLHVGPYSAEAPTIHALHEFIRGHGYRAIGRHHEIYLGDPRRCAPARLRTIIRQPVDG